MRLRGQLFVTAVALGTAVLTTITITVTGAQAGTASALAATPGGTLSDVISPSSGPTLNSSPLPPFPPANLTVTGTTGHSVTLSWTASRPGCCSVAGYRVLRYSQESSDPVGSEDVGNVTTATITANIQPAMTYRFAVVAYDSIGVHVSAPSNSVTAVTPSDPGSPSPSASAPPNPGAPTNVTATRVTSTSVTLTWTAPTPPGCCDVDSYDIAYYRIYNDYGWEQQVGNVTTATVTANIQPLAEYRFYVYAKDAQGHTTSSDPLELVTPIADTGDTTPPPAPTHLTATGYDGVSVQLSWTPPADTSDVTGYNVYSFDGVFVTALVGSTSDTRFTARVACTTSSYFVRSRDAAGNVSTAANSVALPGPRSCAPSSSAPPPPPTCRVSYANSEWPGGFVANIGITNTGGAAIDSWTLTYTLRGDQQITGSWGGTATQSGATVTLRNMPWNATIAPGATVYVGAQGTWHSSDAVPAAFAVNGSACTTS